MLCESETWFLSHTSNNYIQIFKYTIVSKWQELWVKYVRVSEGLNGHIYEHV